MRAFSSQPDPVDLLGRQRQRGVHPDQPLRSRRPRPEMCDSPTCVVAARPGQDLVAHQRRGSARRPGGCRSVTARVDPVAQGRAVRLGPVRDARLAPAPSAPTSPVGLASSSSSCRSTRSTLPRVATLPAASARRRLADAAVEVRRPSSASAPPAPAPAPASSPSAGGPGSEQHLRPVARIDRPLVDGAVARGDLALDLAQQRRPGHPIGRAPAPPASSARTRPASACSRRDLALRWPRGWGRACDRRSGGRRARWPRSDRPPGAFPSIRAASARRTGAGRRDWRSWAVCRRHGRGRPILHPHASNAGRVTRRGSARPAARRPARPGLRARATRRTRQQQRQHPGVDQRLAAGPPSPAR